MNGSATNSRESGHEAAWTAAKRLSAALEGEGFEGWDPYDALTSAAVRACARTPLLRRLAIQSLKWSPVNPRAVLRIPRQQHTKALALCAAGYCRLARLDPTGPWAALARTLAERLAGKAIERPGGGVGWGYDFEVETRWGHYRRGEPNAVATAFAANALLDLRSLTGDDRFAELPLRAATFTSSELLVERRGGSFFGYYPGATTPVHNASLLLVSVLVRLDHDLEVAERAVAFSLEQQRPDGAWPYGDDPALQWVDGFHTAYVLDALGVWHRHTGSDRAADALRRGLGLYLDRLIEPDGTPRATLDARFPIDIHSASSAVTALSRLREYDDRALPTAERVLGWALGSMTRRDGRFAFRRHRLLRNSVPYIRWSDGHMLLALSSYLDAVGPAPAGAAGERSAGAA
jgi:hypothetical protein